MASHAFRSTMMREDKKRRLVRKGWRVGNLRGFLALSPDEEAYLESRLRLADGLKRAGDPTVSLDLLIRSLFALGASRKELARIIGGSESLPAA
jgi:hypothetical protein